MQNPLSEETLKSQQYWLYSPENITKLTSKNNIFRGDQFPCSLAYQSDNLYRDIPSIVFVVIQHLNFLPNFLFEHSPSGAGPYVDDLSPSRSALVFNLVDFHFAVLANRCPPGECDGSPNPALVDFINEYSFGGLVGPVNHCEISHVHV